MRIPDLRSLAPLVALAGLALTAASASPAPPPAGDELLNLYGERVTVYYSPGYLDRAARVQERLHDFCLIAQRSLPGAVNLQVYVLSRADWGRAESDRPYGLPASMGFAIAVPAHGDDGTVELWERLADGMMPIVEAAPMRGSPKETASLVLADLMATSMAAQRALGQAGVRTVEPWLEEVLGHAVAVDYMTRREPPRVGESSRLYAQLQRLPATPEWSAQLSRSAWYYQGGELLAREAGKSLLGRLAKDAKKGDGRVGAGQLSRRYPDFGSWVSGAAP